MWSKSVQLNMWSLNCTKATCGPDLAVICVQIVVVSAKMKGNLKQMKLKQ